VKKNTPSHNPMPPARHTPFGTWLRRARIDAGMTQQQLADASGVTQTTVSNLEQGATTWPQRRTRTRLEAVLGTGPARPRKRRD